MSQFESRYDCIVIGTGKSGQASVEALKEKGLNPLYIHLTAEMLTTMVSQQIGQQTSPDGDSSSQTGGFMHANADGCIYSQKQTLQTPFGETTTYTFQVQQPALGESVQESKTSTPEPFSPIGSLSDGEDPEVLEAQQVEYVSPYPFLNERSRRKKAFRRHKNRFSFQEQPEMEEEYPIYHLERIKLEDEESKDEPVSGWQETPYYDGRNGLQEDFEKKDEVVDSETPPVYRERELKLRKRLTENHRMQGVSESDHEEEEAEDSISKSFDNDFFQDSGFFQDPMFKPFAYPGERNQPNQTGQQPFESQQYEQNGYDPSFEPRPFSSRTSFDSDSYESDKNEQANQEQDVFPLEPFSPRRRSRNQKKARLQSLTEQREKKELNRPASIFWEETPQEEDHSLFPNGQPTIQPFGREPEDEPEKEGDSSLKRDDIEFEDAYGGYNSWEEFMTPFSQNSRKRQEIDKVEKRKIALRGLHNLINNLG